MGQNGQEPIKQPGVGVGLGINSSTLVYMLIAIQAHWNSGSAVHQAFVPNQENRNHIENIRIFKIGHLWLTIIIYA